MGENRVPLKNNRIWKNVFIILFIFVFACLIFITAIISGINIYLQIIAILIAALGIIHNIKNLLENNYFILSIVCLLLLFLFIYSSCLMPASIYLTNPGVTPGITGITEINWEDPEIKSWLNSSLVNTIPRADSGRDAQYEVNGIIRIPLLYYFKNGLVIEPSITTDKTYVQHKFSLSPGLFQSSFNGYITISDMQPDMNLEISISNKGKKLANQKVKFIGHGPGIPN